MAITQTQHETIINLVNSSDFQTALNGIIAHCIECVNSYCAMRDRGEEVSWMLPHSSEVFVKSYLLTAKLPFVRSPSMSKYITAEILKKYGSLLDKKINERLKMNSMKKDFK